MDIPKLRKLQQALTETTTYNQNRFWGTDEEDEEKHAEEYKEESLLVSCQTPACVAGHAIFLFCEDGEVVTNWSNDRAADILGLNQKQARDLFYSDPYDWDDRPVTQKEAVRAIASLIKTGVVTWPKRRYKL